jgi:hypothetical protein
MQPHLSKGEEWMLRYAGIHHKASRKTCEVLGGGWPPPEDRRPTDRGMPVTFDDAKVCVSGLQKRQLIEATWHSGGVIVNITGSGLDCLWDMDNPDIVARIGDWARRSPYMAYLVLIVLGIGAASGFLTLLWNIVTAGWTWLSQH